MSKDHYVPQFRQRLFANDAGLLAVINKQAGRIEKNKRSPASRGYGPDFYRISETLPNGDVVGSRVVDEALKILETRGAALIRRIVEARSIGVLSPDQWQGFCEYMVAEWLRSPLRARMLRDGDLALTKAGVIPPPGSHLEALMETSEVDSRCSVFGMIVEGYSSLLRDLLLSCEPKLYFAPVGEAFVLGDGLICGEQLLGCSGLRMILPLSTEQTVVLEPPQPILERPSTDASRVPVSVSAGVATSEQVSRWNCLQFALAENYVFARDEIILRGVLEDMPKSGIPEWIRPTVQIKGQEST